MNLTNFAAFIKHSTQKTVDLWTSLAVFIGTVGWGGTKIQRNNLAYATLIRLSTPHTVGIILGVTGKRLVGKGKGKGVVVLEAAKCARSAVAGLCCSGCVFCCCIRIEDTARRFCNVL